MKKLYVMGPAHYGFAHDFYKYVLDPLGFDVYRQSSATHYYLKMLTKRYDLIWVCSKTRGFLTLLMKRMPLLKKRMENTKVIIRFHREANAFFHEKPETAWMPYMTVMGCDEVVWVYDCFEELQYYVPQLPQSRFHIVHNGIDLDVYEPNPANRHPKTIFTLSSWHSPKKSLETLIEAMEYLPKWELHIAGKFLSQNYEDYCRRLAKPYGDSVVFLGFAPDKALQMTLSDVFVMPSRQEAWSTQVMEAMACGCKVVAPHIGGMPQFVPKEELIPIPYSSEDLAERVMAVSEHEELRHVNREAVMPYSWQNIIEETKSLLC